MTTPDEILEFWFGPSDDPFERSEAWWTADPAFDDEIRERFEEDVERAVAGKLDEWRETPKGAVAFVILVDQFSRNIYRDTAGMFANDGLALEAALEAIDRGFDEELEPIERQFLYMPLMHAEDPQIHERSLELFDRLREEAPAEQREGFDNAYEFAVKHAEIIDEFGRYPHRNEVLGRESTEEEAAFLEEKGRGF